jgi:hypothetical protein
VGRKLRLSIVLPAVQVSVTAILNVWANRVDWIFFGETNRAPGRFVRVDLLIVYARLIWRGVNAPTYPFCILSGNPTYWTLGFGSGGLLYLVAVAFLWYRVGRFFDRHRGLEVAPVRRITPLRRTVTLLLVIWGVLLLAFSILMIHQSLALFPDATRLANLRFLLQYRPYEPCALFLFLIWSVTLIAIHGTSLARSSRSES